MKKSILELLSFLIIQKDFVSSNDISLNFSWSKRQTRNNLDNLDIFLASQSICTLERSPRKGVRIPHQERQLIKAVISEYQTKIFEPDFLTSKERQLFIIWGIICSSEIIKIDTLAKKIFVSRSTINIDLKSLKEKLTERKISIAFTKNKGFFLTGDEFKIRMFLITFIKKTTDGELNVYNEYDKILFLNNQFESDFKIQDSSRFFDFLESLLPDNYSSESKRYISIYLTILILRKKKVNITKINDKIFKQLATSDVSDLSDQILQKVNSMFGIEITKEENYWLTLILITLPSNGFLDFDSSNPLELEVLTYKIIELVSLELKYPFYEDRELHNIILSHLAPAIYRLEYNCQISNPLLEMILKKYEKLHQSVRAALQSVEEYVGFKFSEDEVSFFTLYFASSTEKIGTRSTKKKRIIIVCNSGNAVSRLLQYKMLNYFSVEIIETTSEATLYSKLKNGLKADLIVSVIPLAIEKLDKMAWVVITPFLNDQDLKKLSNYLPKIKTGIFIPHEETKIKEESPPHLLDLLTSERFLVDTTAKDLNDLIEKSGNLLTITGCTTEEYTKEMVEVIKNYGTLGHLQIAPGIILPHAKISKKVKHPGISFVRINKAVDYQNNQIRFALAMCTIDKKIHNLAIRELGILLNNEHFLQGINKVNTYHDFSNLVRKIL